MAIKTFTLTQVNCDDIGFTPELWQDFADYSDGLWSDEKNRVDPAYRTDLSPETLRDVILAKFDWFRDDPWKPPSKIGGKRAVNKILKNIDALEKMEDVWIYMPFWA